VLRIRSRVRRRFAASGTRRYATSGYTHTPITTSGCPSPTQNTSESLPPSTPVFKFTILSRQRRIHHCLWLRTSSSITRRKLGPLLVTTRLRRPTFAKSSLFGLLDSNQSSTKLLKKINKRPLPRQIELGIINSQQSFPPKSLPKVQNPRNRNFRNSHPPKIHPKSTTRQVSQHRGLNDRILRHVHPTVTANKNHTHKHLLSTNKKNHTRTIGDTKTKQKPRIKLDWLFARLCLATNRTF
jgi:hypothetical protein